MQTAQRKSNRVRGAGDLTLMNFLSEYDDEDDEGGKGAVARKMASYTAPKDLLIPREAEGDDDPEGNDLLADQLGPSRRIVDRESDYHKRRLNRTLSPPRVDPFAPPAKNAGGGGEKLRTYGDAVKEANKERERFDKLRELQEQERRREEGLEAEGTGEAQASTHNGPSGSNRLPVGERRVRERSRSPVARSEDRSRDESGHQPRSRNRTSREERGGGQKEEYVWGKEEDRANGDPQAKEEPAANFGLSGLLAEETLTYKGIKLKYTEPAEARRPDKHWRLYVFKNGKPLEGEGSLLHVHRQTMYLLGRERKVADIPTDHPSCSSQHAVIQYREIEKEDPLTGFPRKHVFPYLMDLGSTNGTFINTEKLQPQRYYQILEGDTIKFGSSSREYVLLHDQSS